MVSVLTGNNDYLRMQALAKIVADFEKSNEGSYGLEKIDASAMDFGRLLEAVSSMSFLADSKLIIMSGLAENKDIPEKVDEFLDAVAESTELVINEPKFDKRSKLYKTLKKRTNFKEFSELDEQSLAKWLVEEAKERGGKVSTSDANFLIKRVGLNQMSLSQEISKLISYNSEITKASIEQLVEPMPSSTIFELIEAAFSGNHNKAIELYEDQRKQQVEPQAIMGMIAWQVHTMAVVKFNDNDSPGDIASNTKINPFVVRKTLELVVKKSQHEMRELAQKTLELDVKLKTEPINADDAIQHYLLTI